MDDGGPLDIEESPSWMLDAPDVDDIAIALPIDTLDQELPFNKLSWQNFERLCLKLAGTDGDAEYYRLYGTAGQGQGGIDVYVRRRSTTKYATWQSKRHESFYPSDIGKAAADFLAGDWAAKSDRFVLCVRASLRSTGCADKIEECAAQLRQNDIEFLPYDGEQLSTLLKSLPQIVYDFFGLSWVKRFCGEEAAQSVAQRLKPTEFRQLRAQLAACYTSHFTSVDPGVLALISTPLGLRRRFPLDQRFVVPDVMQYTDITADEPPAKSAPVIPPYDPDTGLESSPPAIPLIDDVPRAEMARLALDHWIAEAKHEIVLGAPGAGKSTLLRFAALDMLSATPKFAVWRKHFPEFLPVWVSFAFWTKLIAADRDKCSLLDAIELWFSRQEEPNVIALVRKAYEDKRLVLLVDGIDEWANETSANTAFRLLQSFTERNAIPVFMTSRPHGFRLVTGLDGSWRVSKIAPLTVEQQIVLATAWFAHLDSTGEDGAQILGRSLAQATTMITELQRSGPIGQLAKIPLLLTGLIALKHAQLALPRNRFLAYGELTKLLIEVHPTARNIAALASAPRHSLSLQAREAALSALAYAIHSGEADQSPDSIEVDRAIAVISKTLIQQFGMSSAEATHSARTILEIGEEDIGILVKKSQREVGFFHRFMQEFLSSRHMLGLTLERQTEVVSSRSADPRWTDVVLCLLHQLHRPSEVDGLLATIENIQGNEAILSVRDVLLAEATFGEIRKSPQMAIRLANKAFNQIELSRWPTVRRSLISHAVEGLSSPALRTKTLAKIREWFPRWHSYGLTDAFCAMSGWPDDPRIRPVLWRGLHDEYFDAARAAANSLSKRYAGQTDVADALFRLISRPPTANAAAAAIEALWRGWQTDYRLADILNQARNSDHRLIVTAGIRGRIALGRQDADDFAILTDFAARDDVGSGSFIDEVLVAGWAGDERLRTYALEGPPNDSQRPLRRLRPDFGLLISGFPGDQAVAQLIAADFKQEHPNCLFDRDDLRSLAQHFKGNSTIVAALETWVMKHRSDDAYTISHAARVAPTPTFKNALLKCIEKNHLAFWAASALIDLWGAQDADIQSTLLEAAPKSIERRENIAHVLPFVMTDRAECRRLLLEIVEATDRRIRADFALQGLRNLGIDASDREAADRVLARGYDEERFVVENEAREVIATFHADPRVADLAKRQLQRVQGVVGIVASVYADNAEMRHLVLDVAAPLELNMRLALLDGLAARCNRDDDCHSLISAARREEAGEIVVGASIKLAQCNWETDRLSEEYSIEMQRGLEAVGARMDQRRQAALAALVAIRRFDLISRPDDPIGLRGIGFPKYREMLRFLSTSWETIAVGFGGDRPALDRLGVSLDDFFDVFGNDLNASPAIGRIATRLIESAPRGATAAALRFTERRQPRSGFLRELCLRSLRYNGRSNWDSYSTALTAGEVLGRNFSEDGAIEDELLTRLDDNLSDPGVIMALCEGWPSSNRFCGLRSRFDPKLLRIAPYFRLTTVFSTPEYFVRALGWASDNLRGDLWESLTNWVPAVIKRLKDDDDSNRRMRDVLFAQPSAGVKASFPRLLARARTLDNELSDWCRAESARDMSVVEVGMDLIASQPRFVSHSLFDLLSGRDI